MTARELYEIVKDVPREAWPTHLQMSDRLSERGLWTIQDDEWYITNNHAENAFVGSMTAWLLRTYGRIETQSTPWGSVECTTCGEERRVEASSLVAALAAACKKEDAA